MGTSTASGRSTRRRPRGTSPAGQPAWDHAREIRVLRELWREQSALTTADGLHAASMSYVAEHFGMDLTLRRRLRVLDRIGPHLSGKVLEWGCQCAIDSCVYRMRYGDALELHGADLFEARAFPVFFGFSGVEYKHLTDHVLLDYPSETFDVVTSNGVLEHVHDDVGSVCEVDRVLKPGGKFVIDCLPSRWSYTEAIQRALGHNAHDKLYTIDFTRRLVEGTRLRLIDAGYSFVLPTMLYGFPGPVKRAFQRCSGAIWRANDVLERLWPINRLASNLWFVFQKPGDA